MSNSDSKSKQVTSPSAWRKAAALSPAPLELPSGNVCLCRVPGPAAFLTQGLVPNTLLPIVKTAIDRAEKGRSTELTTDDLASDLLDDPEKLRQVFEMADAVTIYCVIEPKVLPIPPDDLERDPEMLYVDEIDLDDKMYIMSVAMGGAKDLESFRDKPIADVGDLRSGKGVASSPKRPPRSRSR
jgi:hypothetical protein